MCFPHARLCAHRRIETHTQTHSHTHTHTSAILCMFVHAILVGKKYFKIIIEAGIQIVSTLIHPFFLSSSHIPDKSGHFDTLRLKNSVCTAMLNFRHRSFIQTLALRVLNSLGLGKIYRNFLSLHICV